MIITFLKENFPPQHVKPDTWLSEKYPRAQMYLFERLRELGVMPPEEPSEGAEAEAAAVEVQVAGGNNNGGNNDHIVAKAASSGDSNISIVAKAAL